MKKTWLIVLFVLLAFILVACNNAPSTPSPPVPPPTPAPAPTPEPTPSTTELFNPLSNVNIEIEFFDLLLTIPDDIFISFPQDDRIELWYTNKNEEFPMTRVARIQNNEILDMAFAESFFESLNITNKSEIQLLNINGKNAYKMHFHSIYGDPTVLTLVAGNRGIYTVSLNANDDDEFNFFNTYYENILKSISELEISTQLAIYELTEIYDFADGVEEFTIEVDFNDNISIEITYHEPYERNDFPSLVVPFIDNVLRIANEHDVLVSKLRITLNQDDKSFVYYISENESVQNDGLKKGRMTFLAYRYENDRSDIEYTDLFTYDEGIEALVTKWSGLVNITGLSTSRPNSAGGVNATINWRNESDNEIKYITFDVEPFNAVDDSVSCEIRRNSSVDLEFTGPFRSGSRNTSTERNVWYNKDIRRAQLNEVEIEFMDGTTEVVRRNFLGFNEWWNSMMG